MKNGTVNILIATSEDTFFEVMEAQIQRLQPGTTVVLTRRVTNYDKFVEEGQSGKYAVVVLCANALDATQKHPWRFKNPPVDAIREIREKSNAFIVVLTTLLEWEQPLLEAGANVFMPMPYRLEELTSEIERGLASESIEPKR